MARRIDIKVGIIANSYYELSVGTRENSTFPLKMRPKEPTLPEIGLTLYYYFRDARAFNIELWPNEGSESLCYIEAGANSNEFRIVIGGSMVVTMRVIASYGNVQELIPEPYPVSIGAYGSRRIHWAAMIEGETGLKELKYWIEEREEDPDVTDDFGTTPLHMATLAGAYENAKYLLKAGANAACEDKKGVTPFAIAEKNGNETLMSLIAAAMFIA